jgi:hypothetical protein
LKLSVAGRLEVGWLVRLMTKMEILKEIVSKDTW